MSTSEPPTTEAPASKTPPAKDAAAKAKGDRKPGRRPSIIADAAISGAKEADDAGGKVEAAAKRKPGRRPSVAIDADGAPAKALKQPVLKEKVSEADQAGGKAKGKGKGDGDEGPTKKGDESSAKGEGKGRKGGRRATWTGPSGEVDTVGGAAGGAGGLKPSKGSTGEKEAGPEPARKSSKESSGMKAADKAAGGKKATIADKKAPDSEAVVDKLPLSKPWWMFGCCSVAMRTSDPAPPIVATPVATPQAK